MTDWALNEITLKEFLAANNIKALDVSTTDPDRGVLILFTIGPRSLLVI